MAQAPPDLESAEVRPVVVAPSPQAEAAAQAWVAERRASRAHLQIGQVFLAGGQEFAVAVCSPLGGGALSSKTEVSFGAAPVPALQRVQLTYLDVANPDVEEDANDAVYQEFVRPFLLDLRKARRLEGGHFLVVLSQDQVLTAAGCQFGVRALDPCERYGALDEKTAVFVSHVETLSLMKVHVLPYEDTLPGAYAYNLFRDFLQPFFLAHPFSLYNEGDHFTYRGVRFRVMATDPPRVTGRVSTETIVFSEGAALRPTVWDFMPAELREDLRRLPRGLQALLLNTMANEEAMRTRLTEVHEVLRPGQGLESGEIRSCGRTVQWVAAERRGDTQQQCMVCLTDFEEGDSLRQLGCSHLFHVACIDEWLRRSAACPICKRPAGGSGAAGAASGDSGSAAALQAGILQNARVAYDGCNRGAVVGFDAASQKLSIAPEDGGQVRVVAVDELVQCLAGVQLMGLRTDEFNGHRVQIIGIDTVRGRYQVRDSHDRVLGVRPDNCILPDGSVARVVGLRASGPGARWNGHFGRIITFDRTRMRHVLAMHPRGQLLSVKPRNLRV